MKEALDLLEDILVHADKGKLSRFIKEYAGENEDFRAVFLERCSPKPKSGSVRKKPEEDYVKRIQKAFDGSCGKKSRYRNDFEDVGFDALTVRDALEPLLEKAHFYCRHDNKEEAIRMAQCLIDTIPDYWDGEFDYDGDVQVVYDAAIDLLEELLKEGLSEEQKERIFSWYEKAVVDEKHEYVGLNTSLDVLEHYFISGAADGFNRVLRIMDQRIVQADEYQLEQAVLDKVNLLVEHGRMEDADRTMDQFLYCPGVRAIRLSRLLEADCFDDAIRLLDEGIALARKNPATGTLNLWRRELLSVYTMLNNREKMVELTKALFIDGVEQRACYQSLKKLTPKKEWPEMLAWILSRLPDCEYCNARDLKADILVEHGMWEELWRQCRKGEVGMVRAYEKYLIPTYEKAVFALYLQYVQRQATITDKEAYKRVADMLNWMTRFEGGPAVVGQLVNHYRQMYKRRVYMMKALDGVKV